jgi:hypothetical protein
MTNLERLRLGTALAHVVPGATLHLSCHSGQHLNVGAHPTADLDACALRKVVIASSCPDVPDYSELVSDIQVCGSLQHIGGGVHRRVVGDVEQRWIATLLRPTTVASLLDDCGPNGIPHDAMHACLKPDGELAVTCVAITANTPRFDRLLDEVAAQAMSAFLVEELLRATRQDVPMRPADIQDIRATGSHGAEHHVLDGQPTRHDGTAER